MLLSILNVPLKKNYSSGDLVKLGEQKWMRGVVIAL